MGKKESQVFCQAPPPAARQYLCLDAGITLFLAVTVTHTDIIVFRMLLPHNDDAHNLQLIKIRQS
ncbi:hypothetical protein E2C01_097479 [Portunus trituberculatus]|uniref:Uncharacterized protein n=1 Tax=Portunus trituberculatus TaxID=210409 RepID=A0A5B7K4J6_PORTR|nr:hypothetical protein [Portunus trituberculatus]